MSTYLDRAKKKVKSFKIQNFDQTYKKWIILTRPVGVRYSGYLTNNANEVLDPVDQV